VPGITPGKKELGLGVRQIFIFDGDCAFCSSAMRVMARMTKGRIPHLPYQHLNLAELGVAQADAQRAVQYLNQGHRSHGALAIANMLIDSKTSWSLAGYLIKSPVLLSMAVLVYEQISKNRHRLPGGTPACAIKPEPETN
jgi:predicted DCC family thiol-disulfide oxidoreductase YuxK